MATRIGNVTVDCADVLRLAAFWSAVLDRPVDAGGDEYFATIGGGDGERRDPAWYFSKVPEAKLAKNRVHVDLVDRDPDAVARLVELGATVVGNHEMAGHSWTVLLDPEGNEFCLADKAFTGA